MDLPLCDPTGDREIGHVGPSEPAVRGNRQLQEHVRSAEAQGYEEARELVAAFAL